MKRSQIIKKILINSDKIKSLRNENIELNRLHLLLTDKTQQYTEQEESFGRGKSKTTHLIGRVHWKEYLVDEDTHKKIQIPRSCIVKKDGQWVEGY
ncbi:hypothetical protein [Mucilaginibacter sp. SP1R1]|uniref:hypothetical protein n=1 Tax=Mucilaginibacter sp. SP1R1 TaxID=2723091 RepID=UPI001621815B|nr:hypothetical protein [Mucilaginibacter sp. SP1R1]MBB6149476.1 hypothetical protein [Mucilaginibacter sp. SP1R1]